MDEGAGFPEVLNFKRLESLSTRSVGSFSCPSKVHFTWLPETWVKQWGNIFKYNP